MEKTKKLDICDMYPDYFSYMKREVEKKSREYSSKRAKKHLLWIKNNIIIQSKLLQKENTQD